MYQKMLVLLDGSELSEVVLPFAREFAARLNMNVVLFHVYGTIGREMEPVHQAYIKRSANTLRRQVKNLQKEIGVKPGDKSPEVRGELANGDFAEEILRYSEENDIDLILMASHGRSGIRRWRMGNVASKVLHASKVPVLFVRAGVEDAVPYDQWPTQTLLLPLDGSENADTVLSHVEILAKQRGIKQFKVTMIRVCEPLITPSYYSPEYSGVPLNWGDFMEQEMARCKNAATEYLAATAKRLEDAGIPAQSEILVGKAADEIVDYAGKTPYSIIVMTTHGRSGLSRLVFGSVTANVLNGVSNPLLLIRPAEKDES